eukprot:GILJ01021637.1.p1 GENE.GILJ01021637.1~~GILJ01021637.1.p1  ORF type:complete len:499 (+),score=58.56 GILJ01021637.1:2-1498(+)
MGCCTSRPRVVVPRLSADFLSKRHVVASGSALGGVRHLAVCCNNALMTDAVSNIDHLPSDAVFIASLHALSNHRTSIRLWGLAASGWHSLASVKPRWSRREKEMLESICCMHVTSGGMDRHFILASSNRTINNSISEDDDTEYAGLRPSSSTGGAIPGLSFQREFEHSVIHNVVKVWDALANMAFVTELRGHEANVTSVCALDNYIFSGDDGGSTLVFECHLNPDKTPLFSHLLTIESEASSSIQHISATYIDCPPSPPPASTASPRRSGPETLDGTGATPAAAVLSTPSRRLQWVSVQNGVIEERAHVTVWIQKTASADQPLQFERKRHLVIDDACVTAVHMFASGNRELVLLGVYRKSVAEVWLVNLKNPNDKAILKTPAVQKKEPEPVSIDGSCRPPPITTLNAYMSEVLPPPPPTQFAVTCFEVIEHPTDPPLVYVITADGIVRVRQLDTLSSQHTVTYNSGVRCCQTVANRFIFSGHDNGDVKLFPASSFCLT